MYEIFRQDEHFKLFLANQILDKLLSGEPISKYTLYTFAHSAFDLKDVRHQVANYLINTEHLYSLKTRLLVNLLLKIMSNALYTNDPVFKHLI